MTKLQSRMVALVVGAAGLTAMAATASADGYERRGYAPAACCFSWTGFYVGINGGYGFNGHDDSVVWNETFAGTPFFPTAANPGVPVGGTLKPAGGFFGGQIGYNQQLGSFVVGIEADLQGADISDTTAGITTPYLIPGGVATMASKNSVGWFGTLRPRLGFAFDRTLLYGTGGLAVAGITHEMNWADNFGFSLQDRVTSSQVGYVLGGGIEYGFSHNLRLKLEYQYLDFGTTHYKAAELFGPGGAATAFAINTDTRTDFHTVRVGLNWKWDERREAPLK